MSNYFTWEFSITRSVGGAGAVLCCALIYIHDERSSAHIKISLTFNNCIAHSKLLEMLQLIGNTTFIDGLQYYVRIFRKYFIQKKPHMEIEICTWIVIKINQISRNSINPITPISFSWKVSYNRYFMDSSVMKLYLSTHILHDGWISLIWRTKEDPPKEEK